MFSKSDLRKIVNKVGALSEDEKKEVFKILDRNNVKYTENSNGIYIILTQIPENIIKEINTFLDFCQANKVKLDTKDNEQMNEKHNIFGDQEDETSIEQTPTPTDNKYKAKITHQNELDKYGLNLDNEEEDVDVHLNKNRPKYSGIKAKIIKSGNKTKGSSTATTTTE